MENTWLERSATGLTINEDIWREYTKTHHMLSKIRRLRAGWRINQEEHLWDSRETMVNSADVCGPALPREISNPNKSWKNCCLLVRKLFSGHILGIYCAPVVRHPLPVMPIDDKLGGLLMTHQQARGRARTRNYTGWKVWVITQDTWVKRF